MVVFSPGDLPFTIPTNWVLRRVRDVFAVQQGKQVSIANREGTNQRPFLRTKNVLWGRIDLSELDQMSFTPAEEERLALREGDLLLCEGGSVGRTALWRGELACCYYQNHLHRLRPQPESIVPAYGLYWFWYAFDVGDVYFGRRNVTTIPNMSKSRVAELPIPVPPLPEQRRIAALLSAVQRAIEQQEKLISLTAELKKALMQMLFTEGTRGEAQKETEIGLIPESWALEKLGSLLALRPANGLYKPMSSYGTGVRILRIDDFSNEGDVARTAHNLLDVTPAELRRYSLEENDIVVNRVNSLSHLGKTALVGPLLEPMLFESNMMRFRVNEKVVLPAFVFRLMNSPVVKRQILNRAKRAVAQSSINQGDVSGLLIPLPPLDEQHQIAQMLETSEREIRIHRTRNALLQSLFRTLLHQLMTAQLRVHQVDMSELKALGIEVD